MLKARPILNVFAILSGTIGIVPAYADDNAKAIARELRKESPAALILADLFQKEPSFFKVKLGTYEAQF